MSGALSDIKTLLALEWRRERHVPQMLPAMLLSSVGLIVIFRIAASERQIDGTLAAALLMVSTIIGALLGIGRLWAAEYDDGGLEAFRLTPASRGALIAAKAIAMWTFLVCVQLVAVPSFLLLSLSNGISVGMLPALIGALLLVDLGIAVLGAIVGALAAATGSRELLVPLIGVPLLIPLVSLAAELLAPMLEARSSLPDQKWWLAVAVYDLLFLLIGWALSDGIIED